MAENNTKQLPVAAAPTQSGAARDTEVKFDRNGRAVPPVDDRSDVEPLPTHRSNRPDRRSPNQRGRGRRGRRGSRNHPQPTQQHQPNPRNARKYAPKVQRGMPKETSHRRRNPAVESKDTAGTGEQKSRQTPAVKPREGTAAAASRVQGKPRDNEGWRRANAAPAAVAQPPREAKVKEQKDHQEDDLGWSIDPHVPPPKSEVPIQSVSPVSPRYDPAENRGRPQHSPVTSMELPWNVPNWKGDKYFPGINVTFTGSGPPHPHPHLAFERAYIEEYCHDVFARRDFPYTTICDVGGSLTRNRGRLGVWTMAPKLTARDHAFHEHLDIELYCEHTLQSCVCQDDDGQPLRWTYLLFHHSAYYIPPIDIARALRDRTTSRRALVVVHMFDDPKGHMYGDEATYAVLPDDILEMRVVGTGHTYKHSTASWLRYPQHWFGDFGLTVNLHRIIGYSHVYELTLLTERPPVELLPQRQPFFLSTTNTLSYTTVDYSLPSGVEQNQFSRAGLASLKDVRGLSWGSYFIVGWETSSVAIIPKRVMAMCIADAAMCVRNQDALASLVAKTRRYLTNSGWPPEDWSHLVSAIAATALTVTLDRDLAAMNVIATSADKIQTFNQKRESAFVANPVRLSDILLCLSGGAVIYRGVQWRFAANLLPTQHFASMFVNPVVEEVIKTAGLKITPWFPALFGIGEFAVRVHELVPTLGLRGALQARIAPLAFHVATADASFLDRCVYHLLYNLYLAPLLIIPVPGSEEEHIPYASSSTFSTVVAVLLVAYKVFVWLRPLPGPDEQKDPPRRRPNDADWHTLREYYQKVYRWAAAGWSKTRWGRNKDDLNPVSVTDSVDDTAIVSAVETTKPEAEVNPSYARIVKELDLDDHVPEVAAILVGVDVGSHAPIVPAVTQHNARVCLTTRAVREPPPLDEAEFKRFRKWVFDNFETLFNGPVNPKDFSPFSFETWNAKYPLAVQKRHLKAKVIVDNGWCNLVEIARVKNFQKVENYVGKLDANGCPSFKPRLISAATDEYNVLTGPSVSKFTMMIRQRWTLAFWITLHSGLSSQSIGEWMNLVVETCPMFPAGVPDRRGRTVKCGDFEAFDASQSPEMRELAIDIHERFGMAPKVIAAQRKKITKRGKLHGYRYKVDGTMASGDQETYVDNSIINALVMIYANTRGNPAALPKTTGPAFDAVERKAVTQEVNRLKGNWYDYRIMVAGDDNIIFGNVAADSVETVKRLGMVVDLQTAKDVTEAEFCSGLFWPIGDSLQGPYVYGPKPGRILTKLPWCVQPNKVDPISHCRAVALGLEVDVSHVPLVRQYVLAMLSHTGTILGARAPKVSPIYEEYRIHSTRKYEEISEGALQFFEQRYGIDREVVKQFAVHLRKARIPCTMVFPPIADIFRKDL